MRNEWIWIKKILCFLTKKKFKKNNNDAKKCKNEEETIFYINKHTNNGDIVVDNN